MFPDRLQQVRDGYNAIADEYAVWSARIRDERREKWTKFLLEQLPENAPILDLGCGNGLPSTLVLASRFAVTGVDFSERQIEAARTNVPQAEFIFADMSALDFPDCRFAAITAFYSIIHLPRERQPDLFRKIAGWLQPGGYLVTVLGATDSPGDVDPDWLGAPMFWSHYPPEINCRMATDAGLEIVNSELHTISEDGVPATFHLLICRKPCASAIST